MSLIVCGVEAEGEDEKLTLQQVVRQMLKGGWADHSRTSVLECDGSAGR